MGAAGTACSPLDSRLDMVKQRRGQTLYNHVSDKHDVDALQAIYKCSQIAALLDSSHFWRNRLHRNNTLNHGLKADTRVVWWLSRLYQAKRDSVFFKGAINDDLKGRGKDQKSFSTI